MLFFLHIPKTAGVTLTRILDRQFQPDEIFPVPDQRDRERMFRELSPEQLARIRFVRGHFWFGPNDGAIHDRLSSKPITITVLRDPVARVISVFQHLVRRPNHPLAKRIGSPDLTLDEFVNHPTGHIWNAQTRLVAGAVPGHPRGVRPGRRRALADDDLLQLAIRRLDTFAVVGLTERLPETIELIGDTFGWQLEDRAPRLNAARRSSADFEVPAQARATIEKANELDARLYEHALRLFEDRVAGKSTARPRE